MPSPRDDRRLLEHRCPAAELHDALGAKLLEAQGRLLDSPLAFGMALAVELVGVADDLLFEGLGHEVLFGERQTLLADVGHGESGAGVALADTRQTLAEGGVGGTLGRLAAQHLGAEAAVEEIGLAARAEDTGGIGLADADVVEHGGVFEKLAVGAQLGVTLCDGEGAVGHLTAVADEETAQIVVVRVIFVDDLLKKHSFLTILAQSYALFQNFAVILLDKFTKKLKIMLIIGIAGGTGSGKTTVVRKIIETLPANVVAVIPQDSYYKHQWDVPEELRKKTNFDHPSAFDWELFEEQIETLRNGQAIEQPTYSYLTCTRQKETIHVEPREVIIVEGIMALFDKKLRDLMDLKIYVDADTDERLLRVIERDIAERGHPLEMLIDKYRNVLKPMHDEFIEPTKLYADIIIPNGGDNARAVAMMRQFITSAYIQQELNAAFQK